MVPIEMPLKINCASNRRGMDGDTLYQESRCHRTVLQFSKEFDVCTSMHTFVAESKVFRRQSRPQHRTRKRWQQILLYFRPLDTSFGDSHLVRPLPFKQKRLITDDRTLLMPKKVLHYYDSARLHHVENTG